MKRILILTTVILLVVTSFWSCVNDTEEYIPVHSAISFSLNVEHCNDSEKEAPHDNNGTSTRVNNTYITQLATGVYDSNGVLVHDIFIANSADNSVVNMEGLLDGAYKVVFIGYGTIYSETSPVIVLPEHLSDLRIGASEQGEPFIGEYFYTITDMVVSGGTIPGGRQAVTMQRLSGLLEVAPIPGDNPVGGISKITITVDAGSLYNGYSFTNGYEGSTQLTNYELGQSYQLYVFPTQKEEPVTGTITIYTKLEDNRVVSSEYPFKVAIGRNKKTIIHPAYTINNGKYGILYVYDAARNASNSKLFFQDGQSYMSIHKRSFYPANPLYITFDNNKQKATISFYSIEEVKDVMVLAKRKNDPEYFEVAWLESMRALEERVVDMSKNNIFKTESGGTVFIKDLGADRLYFKYRSDNEFLNKVNAITWPIKIQYMQPTADTLATAITNDAMAVRPVHARESIVIYTNMGYVLSNGWKEKMLESEKAKPFTNDGRTVSLTNEYFPKIWKPSDGQSYITLHVINTAKKPNTLGISNIGNGNFLGLAQSAYFEHYDYAYASTTPYHEYSHALGYGHNGNLTYNELQTISANVHWSMYKAGQTPYVSNILQSQKNPNIYVNVGGNGMH